MSEQQTITQADIAEHLDMSPRNLRDVLTDLRIDWRATSIDDIRVAYIRKLREAAAGRNDEQLSANRARRELADARMKELDLAERTKQIILAADVEPLLIGLLKEIQTSVLEAGNKALQSIETTHNLKVDDDIVLGHLRAALGAVAASGDQLVATLTAKPTSAVSTATAAGGTVDRKQRKAAGR